ncbi:MAG TPA: DNA translocase FtsK 4TM domain-containing protein [Kiloniellales bacterium]|nr:DNA translocase FtsK 4TM domain-containing protein [Kiloniellales bacterium]
MAARPGVIGRRRGLRTRLLPSGTGAFFRRRGLELCGLVLLAAALLLLAAGLSFDPADPSFNRAVPGPAANWLGWPGAYGSEFVLQSIGLAGFLVPLVLLGWAWRLLRKEPLARWWLRLALVPPTLLLGAAALAALPVPAAWPLGDGLGGFVGSLLLDRTVQASGLAAGLLAPASGLLALAGFLVAQGLRREEWQAAWRASVRTASRLIRILRRVSAWLVRTARALRRLWPERDPVDEASALRAERAGSAVRKREPRLFGAGRSREEEADEDEEELAAFAPRRGGARSDIVAPKTKPPAPGKRARESGQGRLDFGASAGTELPPLSLLRQPAASETESALNADSLEKNARLLEGVLDDFGVRGEIVKVRPGPVVTRYELEPAPGTKTSRVVGLADDIARSMSATSVRVAVVPGSSVIGIELPNAGRETVYLRELLASRTYERSPAKLPLVLGKDIGGAPVMVDLARMPHLLVAGTTGSGKSVAINSMILSLLYRHGPDKCRFIMIDPKMLELSVYDGIPHLLSPVVTEPKKAVVALKWTVREMEDRYRAMSRLGVRNIEGYNDRIEAALKSGEVLTRKVQTGFDPDTGQPIHEEQPFDLEPLPLIVVVVDEMADLMLVAGKEIEMAVQRLAQMARAAGIHLIMATQRPSVDVITGTIKANFPTRISFHVTSKIDSRTILGEQGAEQLLGQGDMLYMAHGGRIARVHGPLVTDREVEEVVAFLKKQGQPAYIEGVTEEEDDFAYGAPGEGEGSGDELYDRAVAVVFQHRKASTSFIQRHLQIGYNRAARLIERMEAEGIVSPANHVGKREVLVPGSADA